MKGGGGGRTCCKSEEEARKYISESKYLRGDSASISKVRILSSRWFAEIELPQLVRLIFSRSRLQTLPRWRHTPHILPSAPHTSTSPKKFRSLASTTSCQKSAHLFSIPSATDSRLKLVSAVFSSFLSFSGCCARGLGRLGRLRLDSGRGSAGTGRDAAIMLGRDV